MTPEDRTFLEAQDTEQLLCAYAYLNYWKWPPNAGRPESRAEDEANPQGSRRATMMDWIYSKLGRERCMMDSYRRWAALERERKECRKTT